MNKFFFIFALFALSIAIYWGKLKLKESQSPDEEKISLIRRKKAEKIVPNGKKSLFSSEVRRSINSDAKILFAKQIEERQRLKVELITQSLQESPIEIMSLGHSYSLINHLKVVDRSAPVRSSDIVEEFQNMYFISAEAFNDLPAQFQNNSLKVVYSKNLNQLAIATGKIFCSFDGTEEELKNQLQASGSDIALVSFDENSKRVVLQDNSFLNNNLVSASTHDLKNKLGNKTFIYEILNRQNKAN